MKTFGTLTVALLLVVFSKGLGHSVPPVPSHEFSSADQVPQGLQQSDWRSIRAAHSAGLHAFEPVEDGWLAHNPGQQWTTRFDRRGFLATPREGGWTWGLELHSYGFGDRSMSITSSMPAVKADGQRLSYQWDANLQEWWVNDQRGLEHGFTLKERPSHDSKSPHLTFLLVTRGTLTPEVSTDGLGVLFQDENRNTVLNYTGLKVWDADGRTLQSRFEPAGKNQVRLLVDEREACYPITIDPIAQQAYLKAIVNDANGSGGAFGKSVAISGDTVVVGSPDYFEMPPSSGLGNSGAVFVFVRDGTTWSQQAKILADSWWEMRWFGGAVALDGDTLAVGVVGTPNASGRVCLFVRNGTTWTQQDAVGIDVVGVDGSDVFGGSVALSGDTLLVGSAGEDGDVIGPQTTVNTSNDNAVNSGAAYVYARNMGQWTMQAYLKPSNTQAGDRFGSSVALDGDTAVVGAPREGSNATGANGDQGNNDSPGSGAAYVFTRNGSTWTQQEYLKASNTGADDYFGHAVALHGDTLLIGAPFEDSDATGVNGNQSSNNSSGSGAAYVFSRSGAVWAQQAYLKASSVGGFDSFGWSVALSADAALVGAFGEDSSATGINGDDTNNSLGDAGAAYFFTRSGATWAQQAYLKASNTGFDDRFGHAVALAGNTGIVGAYGEDSSATGVNGDQSDNSASFSGAAYVFDLTQSSPQEMFDAAMLAAGLTGPDALPTATPHNDGVANLLKYASNMNAAGTDVRMLTPGSGTAGLPSITRSAGGIFRIEFLRRIGSGLVYTPTMSATLAPGSWTPLTDTPAVTPIDADWERVIYEEPYDSLMFSQGFGQVEVTLP